MSTGDFAAELRQSVQEHLALIRTAAKAAKGRIGQSVENMHVPVPAPAAAQPPPRPRPAVNFDFEEPEFEVAAPAPLPEGAILVDDFAIAGVDDDGIPVWEDPP
jgi:hypothetical protein